MISRRAILMTGGAAALVTGLGAVGLAHGPGLQIVSEPWREAGKGFDDPRLNALSYAILAPNPHNRQPWQFELVGDDQINIYCDLERRLPHTDPFDRQITIGFGCMLELLRISAAENGYDAIMEVFPEGEPQPRLDQRPVASVQLSSASAIRKDPLFQSILLRRSTKDPFDISREVDAEAFETVTSAYLGVVGVSGSLEKDRVRRITDLCWSGFMIEYETDRTRRESIGLMRIGNRAIVKNPDGIDMGGIPMGLMKMTGIVTPEGLDTPGSTAYKSGISMYDDIIHSAMGFAWVTAEANTRESQIEAGRAWVRMNLAAQQARLCIHPLSQILQEFPEMAEPYKAIKDELDVGEEGVVHMLGRLGYTKFPAASPRWPLQSRLIHTSA